MNQRKLEENISTLIAEFNESNGCFVGKLTAIADGFRGGKPHYRLVLETHTEERELEEFKFQRMKDRGIL